MTELAREVRRLALPAIVHSLLQTLVFVVDRIMLGQHGDAALASMQMGGTTEWSIWSIFSAFEVGTIARVGRHVGAGDRAGARRAARLSIGIAIALGFLLAAASPWVVAAVPLLAPNVSSAAQDEAQGYLRITIACSPLVFVSATSTATLQAGGDTRTPLAIGVVANIVHVVLNRAFILGVPGWVAPLGARGAGISTGVTFGLSALLATLALASRTRPVSLRAPPGASRSSRSEQSDAVRAEATELFRVGSPAVAERVLYHVGFTTFSLLVARLGDAAMAANQSLISVESICFLSADGFGVAAAALVAQKLGAGKPEEARRVAWIAARYAIVTLTTFGLAAVALRDVVLPLFSGDRLVQAIGRSTMPVLALAQPFMATSMVLAQALRGAGRTRAALGVSATGALLVRIPATFGFAFAAGLGLPGVWLGSTTDWIVRTVVLTAIFRRRSDQR